MILRVNAANRELKREIDMLKAENGFLIDQIHEMGEHND